MEKKNRIVMPAVPGEERKKNFRPFLPGYTETEVCAEASRCLNCRVPQCRQGCPVQNNIPEMMRLVREKDYAGAYEVLSQTTCMPDICGVICPHEKQCEGHCVRGRIDEPLAIGSVERFVGEWAQAHDLTPRKPGPSCGRSAACVGSGPASMACAEKLAEAGYAVTIYEAADYAGGVLTWGIPSYRLKTETVQAHLQRLQDLGVQLQLQTRIGRELSLEQLQKQYDAVFLGTGATVPRHMGIPGEDLAGIWLAQDFLSAVNLSGMDEQGRRSCPACGHHVMVVGGGNVAMDAARDAVRLAQVEDVTIVYRRTEKEMPAGQSELQHAQEEGVRFLTLHNPCAFHGENGQVTSAELCIMELGEPDSSGRRRPVDSGRAHEFLAVDTVILALGFDNDPALSRQNPALKADRWGALQVDEEGRTSLPGVYAGGDAVTGAATVVQAMRAGMRAAAAILKDRQ